jgi:hypothetical protein
MNMTHQPKHLSILDSSLLLGLAQNLLPMRGHAHHALEPHRRARCLTARI